MDEGRFLLSCAHYSLHIKCLLSLMVYYGKAGGIGCPIMDTEKCRYSELDGKRGELCYWGQKQYHSFVIAFLRNRALVEAFIDKQKLSEFNSN